MGECFMAKFNLNGMLLLASALSFTACNDPVNGYFAPIQQDTSTGSTTGSGSPGAPASPGSPSAPVALPPPFVPNGILNGHFDVDTGDLNYAVSNQ